MRRLKKYILMKLIKSLYKFDSFIIVEKAVVDLYKTEYGQLVTRLAFAEYKLSQLDEDSGPTGGVLQ